MKSNWFNLSKMSAESAVMVGWLSQKEKQFGHFCLIPKFCLIKIPSISLCSSIVSIEEDIGGFDVSVHDFELMHSSQSIDGFN